MSEYLFTLIGYVSCLERTGREREDGVCKVSKSDHVIMGDSNHGNTNWSSLICSGDEHQNFMHLTQHMFLTQHVLQHTSVLEIALSRPPELVDKVEIHKPLANISQGDDKLDVDISDIKRYVKEVILIALENI